LYKEWRNGRLRLRCQSIFSELVIHSNGDVPLCQNLGVMLGNVYEHSLDEIFNSREATKVQCQYSRECMVAGSTSIASMTLSCCVILKRFFLRASSKFSMVNTNGQAIEQRLTENISKRLVFNGTH